MSKATAAMSLDKAEKDLKRFCMDVVLLFERLMFIGLNNYSTTQPVILLFSVSKFTPIDINSFFAFEYRSAYFFS